MNNTNPVGTIANLTDSGSWAGRDSNHPAVQKLTHSHWRAQEASRVYPDFLRYLSNAEDVNNKRKINHWLEKSINKQKDMVDKYLDLIDSKKAVVNQLPHIAISEPKGLYDWTDYSFDDKWKE